MMNSYWNNLRRKECGSGQAVKKVMSKETVRSREKDRQHQQRNMTGLCTIVSPSIRILMEIVYAIICNLHHP